MTKPNYSETLIEAFAKRIAKNEARKENPYLEAQKLFLEEVETELAKFPKKHTVKKSITDKALYVNWYLWSDVHSYRVLAENTKTKDLLVVEVERRFARCPEYFGDQPDMIAKDHPRYNGVYIMKYMPKKGIYKRKAVRYHEYDEQGNIIKTHHEYQKMGPVTNRCCYFYDTGF